MPYYREIFFGLKDQWPTDSTKSNNKATNLRFKGQALQTHWMLANYTRE